MAVAVDLKGVEHTAKKKKKKCRRKRRRAGDRSGRQMALRALEKEKKGRTNEEIVSEACPEPASFCRGDSGDPLRPRQIQTRPGQSNHRR